MLLVVFNYFLKNRRTHTPSVVATGARSKSKLLSCVKKSDHWPQPMVNLPVNLLSIQPEKIDIGNEKKNVLSIIRQTRDGRCIVASSTVLCTIQTIHLTQKIGRNLHTSLPLHRTMHLNLYIAFNGYISHSIANSVNDCFE